MIQTEGANQDRFYCNEYHCRIFSLLQSDILLIPLFEEILLLNDEKELIKLGKQFLDLNKFKEAIRCYDEGVVSITNTKSS